MPKTTKAILIKSDGTRTEEEWTIPFDHDRIRRFIGGDMEFVRVLLESRPAPIYGTMVVNEAAIINGLPRNQAATDIYSANVRAAFPNAPNPFIAAREAHRRELEENGFNAQNTIEVSPPGYDRDNPHIAGDVVVFTFPLEDIDYYFYGPEDYFYGPEDGEKDLDDE